MSFDAFARLFRDGLNCPNALFLDRGSASSFYAPSLNSHGNFLSTWSDAGCIRKRKPALRIATRNRFDCSIP